jgi:hypothetical protein
MALKIDIYERRCWKWPVSNNISKMMINLVRPRCIHFLTTMTKRNISPKGMEEKSHL